ncbi:hypothetical protein BDD12DRAFT_890726 [Trichophaea hybrida]|nr:hypothetical protein BDD12DRAFT_890726 [Trichophaea hybrida]
MSLRETLQLKFNAREKHRKGTVKEFVETTRPQINDYIKSSELKQIAKNKDFRTYSVILEPERFCLEKWDPMVNGLRMGSNLLNMKQCRIYKRANVMTIGIGINGAVVNGVFGGSSIPLVFSYH